MKVIVRLICGCSKADAFPDATHVKLYESTWLSFIGGGSSFVTEVKVQIQEQYIYTLKVE